MKLSSAALLFGTTLAIIACSKGGNGGGSAIPTDIPFNEKALPPISDADFARAKLVARTAGEAAGTMEQILIKNDETAWDQSEREKDFNKMRPEIQRLVRAWQADCKPNHQKTGKGIEGQPRAGEVYRSTETNASTGGRCPLQMSQKFDNTITVQAYNPSPLNFIMTISASGAANGAFNDPVQQQVVGATNFNMSFVMTGNYERTGETGSSYSRMDAKGAMETLAYGGLQMAMVTQNLERNGADKTLTTTRLNEAGKDFVFTQYFDQTNKVNPAPRFFIGNRELTVQEVKDMGEFPFTPEENKTGAP